MATYEFIVCDPALAYENRSVFMSAPTNHIACATSDGTPGNLKSVSIDLAGASPSFVPEDPSHYAAVFSISFSLVLTCFLIGRGIGTLVDFIRRG